MTRLLLLDDEKNEFAHLGFQSSRNARELGNKVEDQFARCRFKDEDGNDILVDPRTEEVITAMSIYYACADSESANTNPFSLKDYHYTSKMNVPDDLWEHYHMFGRHHWKALIPRCKDAKELGKMADIVLSWSDEYGGKLIPVWALRDKLQGKDGGPAQWEKRLKTATNACKKLAGDDATPGFIRAAARYFVTATAHPPLP